MFTYEEAKKRYSIIKEFCIKYRTELTYLGAVLAVEHGVFASEKDYIEYVQELSNHEFAGSMLTALQLDCVLESYKRVLNGEMTFEQYVKDIYTEEEIVRYLTYML